MTPSDTPPVGGDWVLVPREPTEEMAEAYNGALRAWVESLTPEQRGRLKRRATATGARQFKISPRQKLIARWLAMLSAAPPPPVGDREAVAQDPWRPIETAPPDGTPIDLWGDGHRWTNMVWQKHQEAWAKPGSRRVSTDRWIPAFTVYTSLRPSHWMPLPDPPSLSPGELEGTGSSVADSGGSRPAAVKSDSQQILGREDQ